MFTYQKNHRFFAQADQGLEQLAGAELAELGATEIKPVYRGIYFDAELPVLYRINYQSRLCTRVLAPLLSFDCHSTKYLYQTALKIKWHNIMDPQKTMAVHATVAHSKIKHSGYASLCLKDAVVDYLREKSGKRPSVDTSAPDVTLDLRVEKNRATISLDTSGYSLHKRGYRLESVEAPMRETLAAALVSLAAWQGDQPLVDPMCGSGTILAEALMHYCRIPAGLLRTKFGFEQLPDFSPKVWADIRRQADSGMRELPRGLISGGDMSARAVTAARKNLSRLPFGDRVEISRQRFQENKRINNSLILCNPPHGIRLDKHADMAEFMKNLGDFLKQNCTGSRAVIYLGKRELLKSVGLRPSWKKTLLNGGIEGVLACYDMY